MEKTVGDLLREEREKKGLNRTELMVASGVTNVQIAAIEEGRTEYPRLDTLQKLARGLGIKTRRLVP